MHEKAYESLIEQFGDNPAIVAYLESRLCDADQPAVDALFEFVDDGDFSLSEWFEALIVFDQWLDAQNSTIALDDQVGYLSCAAASAGAGSNLSHLPTLLEDMLQTYGCERAIKK
jgi:hypothetical protein